MSNERRPQETPGDALASHPLTGLPRSDMELRTVSWSEDGRDLTLELTGGSPEDQLWRLKAIWASALNMSLSHPPGSGGLALTWDIDCRPQDSGAWAVKVDFASRGTIEWTCNELKVTRLR